MTVDLITNTYAADFDRVHSPDLLKNMVAEHRYPFNNIILIQQDIHTRIKHPEIPNLITANTADYPKVLDTFVQPDPDAEHWSGPPSNKYYWRKHCINHFVGSLISYADYLVFQDNDTSIIKNLQPGWIETGIAALKKYSDVLMVCPDDGGTECVESCPEGRKVASCSQQLFLIERMRFLALDFEVPFDTSIFEKNPELRKSTKEAPGRPFKEFYFCLEGRLWRFMDKVGRKRLILRPDWAFQHHFGKINGRL